jgi:hypothetical protein
MLASLALCLALAAGADPAGPPAPGTPPDAPSIAAPGTPAPGDAPPAAAAPGFVEPAWEIPKARPLGPVRPPEPAAAPGDGGLETLGHRPFFPAGPPPGADAARPSAAGGPAPGEAGALRVAVPQLSTTGGVEPRIAAAFENALVAELRKLEGVASIGMADIKDMLSMEYVRQMMGAQVDDKLYASLGRSLGVDEILAVQLQLTDGTWVLHARRFDMRQAKNLATEQRRLKQEKGRELLIAIGPLVAGLYPDRALKAGKSRGVSREALLRLAPPPIPLWAFVATAGGSLGAALAGVGYGQLANDARRDYEAAAQRSVQSPVQGGDLKGIERRMDSRARTSNLFYGLAGALGLAAGVEALFTDWHGYRSALEIVPLDRGGSAVQITGKF